MLCNTYLCMLQVLIIDTVNITVMFVENEQ